MSGPGQLFRDPPPVGKTSSVIQAVFQETASVPSSQILWERSGGAVGPTGGPGLGLRGRLGLQQAQQHAVSPRGAVEAAEGRGGRHRPQTGEDPYKVGRLFLASLRVVGTRREDVRRSDRRDTSHVTWSTYDRLHVSQQDWIDLSDL